LILVDFWHLNRNCAALALDSLVSQTETWKKPLTAQTSPSRQAKEIVLPVFVCSFLDDSYCFFSFQQNFAEQIAKTNQNPVQSCKFFQKASKISRPDRN